MRGTINESLYKNYQVWVRFDKWKLWKRRWFKGWIEYYNSTALNEASGQIWMNEWTAFQTKFGKGDGCIPLSNVRGFKDFFKWRITLYACPLVRHACSLVPLFCGAFLSLSALTKRNRLFSVCVHLACQHLNSGNSLPGNPPFFWVTRVLASVSSFVNY